MNEGLFKPKEKGGKGGESLPLHNKCHLLGRFLDETVGATVTSSVPAPSSGQT